MSLNALEIVVADYPIDGEGKRARKQIPLYTVKNLFSGYLQCRELSEVGERVVGENADAVVAQI